MPIHIIRKLSGCLNMNFLINLSGRSLILPFYHLIADVDRPHTKHLYPLVHSKKFEADLDFLLQYYKPISVQELKSLILTNQEVKENYFFLSFDDGLAEMYDVVAPILLRKSIPATFFLNTDFIDNRAMFFRMKASLLIDNIQANPLSSNHKKDIQQVFQTFNLDYQKEKDLLKIDYESQKALDDIADIIGFSFQEYQQKHPIYLATNQIKELQKQGFSIGSHSCSHPYYYALSEEQQIEETLQSLQVLQAKFGANERLFAFPFTDYQIPKSFFDKISSVIDLSFGTASLKHDSIPTNLQRIPMERNQSAKSILEEEYLLFILKRMLGKEVIKR